MRKMMISMTVAVGLVAAPAVAHATDVFKPLKQTGAVLGALALSGIALQCAANRECKEGVRRSIVGTGAAVFGLHRQMQHEANENERDERRRRDAEAFGNPAPQPGPLQPLPSAPQTAPAR
ncbi:hypothetical protein [Methylobacterium brachiatum]